MCVAPLLSLLSCCVGLEQQGVMTKVWGCLCDQGGVVCGTVALPAIMLRGPGVAGGNDRGLCCAWVGR